MRILERYEIELGTKKQVLERALMGMDKLRFKDKIDPQSVSRIIKRVNTGIPGFDGLIEGGIPEGFVVIVTGPPGTGKTTFSLQFLMEGIKNNERCIFFSFEEMAEQLIKQTIRFGWNIGEYIDKGYLEIFGFSRFSTEEIIEIIDIFKPKRIVFDSLNILSDISDFRRSLQWRNIMKIIKEKRITCLAVTDKNHGGSENEFDEFDFMGDGIVLFYKRQKNEFDTYPTYNLQTKKMRLTKVNEIAHTFVVKENGIELNGSTCLDRSALNTLPAHRAKIEHINTIDRELRISLNSIIGFSELMMVKAPGDLNEKQERYVRNVHTSGKHLLELIQKRY
jgi:circadian clock protein KaiC